MKHGYSRDPGDKISGVLNGKSPQLNDTQTHNTTLWHIEDCRQQQRYEETIKQVFPV